jgi:phytoene desaturase
VVEKEKDILPLSRSRKKFSLVAEVVEACQKEGLLPDGPSDLIAVSFWGMLHGLVSLVLENQVSHAILDRVTLRELVIFSLGLITRTKIDRKLLARSRQRCVPADLPGKNEKEQRMSTVKTVGIVGGGVAGLTAGGLLSKQGWQVKLFEANDKLGGCCATTTLSGYTFNDGALYLAFPGLLDHALEKLGVVRSSLLPLVKIQANQKATLPDGTVVCIGDGLDVTLQKSQGAVNSQRLQSELSRLLEKWEPVRQLFANDLLLHPFSVLQFLAKSWRHLPQLRGTVADELNRLISDEALRATLSGMLLYAGVPPQKMPVISFLGLVAMLSEGFYLPVGGMGQIPQALGRVLIEHGGEILLNSPVRRIVVKAGCVSGLQVEGQGLIEVDAVISTVSGMLTYSSLLNPEEVQPAVRRKVEQAPLSHKAFCLQLGLANRIDGCSHSNSVLPFMEKQYQIFMPEEEDIRYPIYSVPTVTLPELAPPGGSIIEMYPPTRQEMPAEAWEEQAKDCIAQLGIKALSRLHKLDIAVTRVFSPKDFQDSLHLYRGAAYGLSPIVLPTAQFPHRTVIRGLYQAGQTTFPGYGVSPAAMSGIFAAEALLQHSLE